MRWPTPPTGPDGAGITNTAPRPATTPATELGSHDQRSTTAVLGESRSTGRSLGTAHQAAATYIANVCETIFPLSTTNVSAPRGISLPTHQVIYATSRSTRRLLRVKCSMAPTGRELMKSVKKP